MNFYYADSSNQPIGPVTVEQLNAFFQKGEINLDTFILVEGTSDWQAYRTIAPVSTPPARTPVPVQVVRAPQLASQPIAADRAIQRCPFCAEDISAAAKKCKHCGETLDVTMRVAEEARRGQSNRPNVYMNAGGGAASAAAYAHSRPRVVVIRNQKSGIFAALLNLLLPGLGYMYCGRVLLGILAFVLTVAVVAATLGVGALVMYPILFIDGFLAAGRANNNVITIA